LDLDQAVKSPKLDIGSLASGPNVSAAQHRVNAIAASVEAARVAICTVRWLPSMPGIGFQMTA